MVCAWREIWESNGCALSGVQGQSLWFDGQGLRFSETKSVFIISG